MTILSQLNAPPIYLICGGIIAFVVILCVIFLIRAWRAGVALGMDRRAMKRAITSSATFSLLPSVGILPTRPRWPRRQRSRWAWAPCPHRR